MLKLSSYTDHCMDTAIENVRLSLYSGDTLRRQSMGLFSLYWQLCSLTLEAIQSFRLASSGKHSGKHNSPGGEGLAGYRHGRRPASAPASRTAAVSLGTPKKEKLWREKSYSRPLVYGNSRLALEQQ